MDHNTIATGDIVSFDEEYYVVTDLDGGGRYGPTATLIPLENYLSGTSDECDPTVADVMQVARIRQASALPDSIWDGDNEPSAEQRDALADLRLELDD